MVPLNNKNILVMGVVGIVILGGIYLYSSGKLPQLTGGSQEEEVFEEVSSVAGQVVSVDAAGNSFVLLQPKEERKFTVKLGENTAFMRLVFPFDVANPPANATFTPERKAVTIEDLKIDDQVFVRSEDIIKKGQGSINALEVQILP